MPVMRTSTSPVVCARVNGYGEEPPPPRVTVWYGMPAYTKDGKVVRFFQSAQKFDTRYSTLDLNDAANLDADTMWPTAFALTELTAEAEARIGVLVTKAVSSPHRTVLAVPALSARGAERSADRREGSTVQSMKMGPGVWRICLGIVLIVVFGFIAIQRIQQDAEAWRIGSAVLLAALGVSQIVTGVRERRPPEMKK